MFENGKKKSYRIQKYAFISGGREQKFLNSKKALSLHQTFDSISSIRVKFS